MHGKDVPKAVQASLEKPLSPSPQHMGLAAFPLPSMAAVSCLPACSAEGSHFPHPPGSRGASLAFGGRVALQHLGQGARCPLLPPNPGTIPAAGWALRVSWQGRPVLGAGGGSVSTPSLCACSS